MIDASENSGVNSAPAESLPSGGQSGASVLYLSQEQSQAPYVEVRNSNGKVCGYLFHEATLLLTPAEFSDIKRRASGVKSGRSLNEILKEVRAGIVA